MPFLSSFVVCATGQIDDDVPERRHPTVVTGVDPFVDVTLHQRSRPEQSQMEPVIG
jgi:hypothetical protein